jgi:excisionase family DNA binding protein
VDTSRLLLTIPEVAAELRVDKRTVYRLLKTGDLPLQVLRIGQSSRIRRADLERYVELLVAQQEAEAEERARRSAALAWSTRGRRYRAG